MTFLLQTKVRYIYCLSFKPERYSTQFHFTSLKLSIYRFIPKLSVEIIILVYTNFKSDKHCRNA